MPLYTYESISASGKKISSHIAAQNLNEAKEKLRRQGALVVTLTLQKEQTFKFKKKRCELKGGDLLSFTHQLSELLKASLPLYESLSSLEEQYRGEPFHPILVGLCENIKGGSSLSKAMSEHPSSFNKEYQAIVEAGESIGALDSALERMGSLLSKQHKLKRQIITALLYPAILLSFSCVTIFLLLTFVIPSLETLFEGREVNPFTSFVIALSHFFTGWWGLYVPFLLSLPCLLIAMQKKKRFKSASQRFFLKIPFLKKILIETAIARFTRTLGSLLQGGVSMIYALQCARKVMNNPVLEEIVMNSEKKIIEGSLLSIEFKRAKIIPSLVPRILAIGEESGRVQEMLIKLAEIYEDEIEKKLNRFLALLQPGILLLMGAIVGVIMLAVLLPLTDINSFLQGG